MSHRTQRPVRPLLALLAALLAAVGLGLAVVPAQAASPKPTTTRLHAVQNGADLQLNANVWSSAGVPVGTITFFHTIAGSDPVALGAPVTVTSQGLASTTVPDATVYSAGNYTAQFTGAEGWADSSGGLGFFGGPSIRMKAVGTVLHIGGPGLVKLLTRTFSVKASYDDGSPAYGEVITFTEKNKLHGASGHPEMDPNYVYPVEVCEATVDITGYATCTVPAPLGSIVTLLTTPVYANHAVFPVSEYVFMPIVNIG